MAKKKKKKKERKKERKNLPNYLQRYNYIFSNYVHIYLTPEFLHIFNICNNILNKCSRR